VPKSDSESSENIGGHSYVPRESLAVKLGDTAAADLLIKARVNLYGCGVDDHSALTSAALKGNLELVRMLIAANTYLEWRCEQRGTVLMKVANVGNIEMVIKLIGAGADVNACDCFPYTVLSYASTAEVADALIAAHADVTQRDSDPSPLITASSVARADVVDSLLKVGANVDHRSFSGMSALLCSLVRASGVHKGYRLICCMEAGLSLWEMCIKTSIKDTAVRPGVTGCDFLIW